MDSDHGRIDPNPVVSPNALNKFSISEMELPREWEGGMTLWSVPSRELLKEEDYGPLGFRPQDEITTEL